MEITSADNPRFKSLVRLCEKSRARKSEGLFPVEGLREITHCIEAGYSIDSIFFNAGGNREQLMELERLLQERGALQTGEEMPLYALSSALYSKIAYRETTESVVVLVKEKKTTLNNIKLPERPFVLVIESVEKPGNLGALLRSADACGVDTVLICDPLTDLYNPNLIRSSIGGIFTNRVVACSNEEALEFLRRNRIKIFTAQLQDSLLYYDTDFTVPTAIVMGTESTGLTQFWRNASDGKIRIPMLGKLDSLNVSVSAAILCYEVVRQRNSTK